MFLVCVLFVFLTCIFHGGMCSIYVVEEGKVVNLTSECLEHFMFSMCSICVSHMYHVFIFQGGM